MNKMQARAEARILAGGILGRTEADSLLAEHGEQVQAEFGKIVRRLKQEVGNDVISALLESLEKFTAVYATMPPTPNGECGWLLDSDGSYMAAGGLTEADLVEARDAVAGAKAFLEM